MAIDIATFRVRFPEFVDPPYTDALVQFALDDAMICVDEDRWDRFYELGVYYLAAHELTLAYKNSQIVGGAGTGMIQAKSVDKVSYSIAVNGMDASSGDMLYASTSYGLKYLELAKKVSSVGFMVV